MSFFRSCCNYCSDALVSPPPNPLGLESDSDDNNSIDKNNNNDNGGGEVSTNNEAVYLPPRRMELTNLPGIHDRHVATTSADKQSELPTHYITKLPNLVAINPIAYDSTTHDKEKEEEYYRGYVHNMIRWRYTTTTNNDDGGGNDGEREQTLTRESNARVVKWSDGTYTLHVGNEILEVDTIDGSIPIVIDPTAAAAADAEQKQTTTSSSNSTTSFPGNNGYLYVSQKARICQPQEDDNDEDNENIPSYQPAGTVLECIAPITARLVPRPSSLASDAHRNLTLAVRQRNVKRARITEIVTEVDPEKEKMARIKGKEDLERSRARGGGVGGGVGGGRRSNGGGGSRKGGMNEDYLEEDDDDYDGVNLSNIKKQSRQKQSKKKNNDDSDEEMDYGDDDDTDDDDDDDEDGWLAKKNKTRGASSSSKAAAASTTTKRILEDGEVDFGDDDDDDDDEDMAFVSKKKKSTTGKSGTIKAFLSDDDDEDD